MWTSAVPQHERVASSACSGRWSEGPCQSDVLDKVVLNSLLIVAAVASFYLVGRLKTAQGRTSTRLPPGPTGLPLLGSLPFLGSNNIHHRFADLAKTYGPVMSIRLGTKLCLVVSSPAAAREVLKDHDAIFANRDIPAATRVINYGARGIGWNDDQANWRILRKLTVRELLNASTVNSFYSLRRSGVRRMVREVHRMCGTPVMVGEETSTASFDVITNMMWGGTVEGKERSQVAKEFCKAVNEINDLVGMPNISDFIPALARFDLQRVVSRMKKLHVWCDKILNSIIEGRRSGGGSRGKDFLQVMLELVNSGAEATLTADNLKAVMMDMFVASSDTSAATLEWAMAQMMHKREILAKAQEELDRVVGNDAVVEESHIPSLRYLDAVVKETFRLRPVLPLLLPHFSGEPCVLGGHYVPAKTRVLINVWAIHRDPSSWDDPLEFKPERFLRGDTTDTTKWDYRTGNDFRLLPFGSGRRICPGITMGERMTMFSLASLLHSFDWHIPAGADDVDLTENFSLILRLAKPLCLVPTPRLSKPRLYE